MCPYVWKQTLTIRYSQRGWEVTFIKGLNNGGRNDGPQKIPFLLPVEFLLRGSTIHLSIHLARKKKHIKNASQMRFHLDFVGGGGGKGGDAKRKVQKMF